MRKRLPFAVQLAAVAAAGFAGAFAWEWVSTGGVVPVQSFVSQTTASNDCRIKGNISLKGERIYHVPGQEYYDETEIRTRSGERWFCSEAEALAAGWRRSKV